MEITKEQATKKITEMVAATIGVAPAALHPRASLVAEHGLESLDSLDISFRINKEFGVKLYRGDILRKASEALGNLAMLEDGKLTAAAVELLKARMPEQAESPLLVVGAARTVLIQLYCVDSWVRQVVELRQANQTVGEAFLDEWLERYREERLKVA